MDFHFTQMLEKYTMNSEIKNKNSELKAYMHM